ncbi:hypothetical protein BIY24_12025 [Halobacteriovorax marinus]|uniref:hypothetical protein n=1 Tax=Halobacteriovorax marinus TaxID=97084 RepID=UPI000BC3152C|nr:hypothetical protein [Halobacteriovorax marinus]ATH08647.1 hypothetical protein BIY24_12025 [Halobacteriovorax marinus]
MKSLMTLLFLSCVSVSANTVESIYSAESKLHPALKKEIAAVLLEDYKCINAYGLRELSTEVVVDRVDQGVVDYYYTTTFSATYTYDYHPNTAKVVVKSAKYAGSNPTIKWTDIESIEAHILCE